MLYFCFAITIINFCCCFVTGQTCVHVAAIHGNLHVLRHLHWYGADINAREGRSGYTALHYAIVNGDEHFAEFLLRECNNKLDVNAITYGGRNVLQLGFPISSHLRQVLISRGVQQTPLFSSDDEYDSDEDDDEHMDYEVRFNSYCHLSIANTIVLICRLTKIIK